MKLLDFGIAKLLEPDHPLADPTRSGLRALTPAYAAPEQLRGEPVSAATDVYVLGVVLYELLTGQRPGGPDAATRAPRDAPITAPPSVAVRRQVAAVQAAAGTPSALAAARQTSPARLIRRLSGDVDCVVLEALQQEPERRYGSAGQLADDLQRLLDGRPVLAQPDTRGYRLRRFVGRHRVGVAMVAAVATLVVAFAIVAALPGAGRWRSSATGRASKPPAPSVWRCSSPTSSSWPSRPRDAAARSPRASCSIGAPTASRSSSGTIRRRRPRCSTRIARVYGNLGLHDDAIEVLEQRAPPRASGERRRHAGASRDPAPARRASRVEERPCHRRATLSRGTGAAAPVARAGDRRGRNARGAGADPERRRPVRRRTRDARGRRGDSAERARRVVRGADVRAARARDARPRRRRRRPGRSACFASRSPWASGSRARRGRRSPACCTTRSSSTGSITRPRGPSPCCGEALAMARAIHPGDHEDTALCLAALAENLGSLRKLPEAESVGPRGRRDDGCACAVPGTRRRWLAHQFLARVLICRRQARGSGADPEGLAGRRAFVPRRRQPHDHRERSRSGHPPRAAGTLCRSARGAPRRAGADREGPWRRRRVRRDRPEPSLASTA